MDAIAAGNRSTTLQINAIAVRSERQKRLKFQKKINFKKIFKNFKNLKKTVMQR